MRLHLDHFEVAILLALVSSIILGLVTKRSDTERIRYGIYCFGCFVAALFGISWFMHLLHG